MAFASLTVLKPADRVKSLQLEIFIVLLPDCALNKQSANAESGHCQGEEQFGILHDQMHLGQKASAVHLILSRD